jgi:hypothetical protein
MTRAKIRFACVMAALSVALLAAMPADASLTSNTIGPSAEISSQGHLARGTVLIGCTSGQRVDMTLTIRQGDAFATGRGAGVCVGRQKAYPIRTVTRGEGVLEPGPASACASAVNTSRSGTEQRRWCRAGRITLF